MPVSYIVRVIVRCVQDVYPSAGVQTDLPGNAGVSARQPIGQQSAQQLSEKLRRGIHGRRCLLLEFAQPGHGVGNQRVQSPAVCRSLRVIRLAGKQYRPPEGTPPRGRRPWHSQRRTQPLSAESILVPPVVL